MALIGFQQDPNVMPGAGWFHHDDGQDPVYAYHPEMAAALAQNGAGGVAGFQTTDQRLAAGGNSPEFPQQLADFTPPMMPNAGPAGPPAPGAAPQAPIPGAPQPQGDIGPPEPASLGEATTQIADRDVARALLHDQTKPVTRSPAHFSPSTKEESVSDQGAPLSPERLASLQDAHQLGVEGIVGNARAEQQHLLGSANNSMRQAVELEKQRANAMQVQANATQLVQSDKSDLMKFQDEAAQKQKDFNPNRLFSGSAGTLAGIAAAIFRGVGAYAAAKGHQGSNTAGDVIDAAIQRDILQQKGQIESSKGRANNALQRLQMHYGDMGQAQQALSLIQHAYADAQMQFMAAATGVPKVMEDAKQAVAAKQTEYDKMMQGFEASAYGKHSAKLAEKYVPATTSGGPLTVEQAIKRRKELGEINHTDATTEKERADAAKTRDPKANPAIAKAQDQLDSINGSLKSAQEIDSLYGKKGVLTPQERGRLKALQATAPMEVHKGLTGMSRFTDTEGKKYEQAYGEVGESSDLLGSRRAGLGVIREQLARKKAALEKAIGSGVGVPPDAAGSDQIRDVE